MKISIKNIAFYASLILLMSCNGDRFSQVLEIELPEETPVLAVTSTARAGDTALTAFVGHTQGALDDSPFDKLTDATVRLLENGTEIGQLTYDEPAQIHFVQLAAPIKAEAGTTYRMEVSADGYEDVFAEQVMPTKVPVLSAAYSAKSAINFEGDEVDELSVTLKDPADEENFYGFRVYYLEDIDTGIDTAELRRVLYLESIDPLVESGVDADVLINDRSFAGNNYTANFFFYPIEFQQNPNSFNRRFEIEITHLTKDRYLYQKTLLAYRDNKDNPFAEPVTVHSNFENGTGTFTLESTSEFILELEE